MIIGKQYKNLPGMLIDFKDGGKALKFNDETGNTDSILLLGTAVDGPVMEPVAVDDKSVELIFGSDVKAGNIPNGSTLVTAYKQLKKCGSEDIRLMRITGSVASSIIKAPEVPNTETKRVDEELGAIQGNGETVLELGTKHLAKTDHDVYVKGVKLEEKDFTIADTKNSITIRPNVTNAGASVMVKFNHEVDKAIVDKPYTVRESKVLLQLPPKTGANSSFVLKFNDVVIVNEVDNVKYVISGSTVDIKEAAGIPNGSVVKVSYTATVVESAQITETHNPASPTRKSKAASAKFKTAAPILELPLQQAPSGDVVLYIDNAKVLSKESYSIENVIANDPEGKKKICIKQEFFNKDERISVSYNVTKSTVISREIEIESLFGGSIYNLGLIEVEEIMTGDLVVGKILKITKPEAKAVTGELPQTYSSFDYTTYGDLVDAINANNGTYVAKTNCPDAATKDLEASSTYFMNGEDGIKISKQKLFETLSGVKNEKGEYLELGAYHLLENYNVDTVVPLGVYADDELIDRYSNFAYELALFCAATSQRSNTVFGVIAMKPLSNVSLAGVQEYADYLKNYNNNYFMKDVKGSPLITADGNPIDLGKFISVVAGPAPMINHQTPSLREANPAVVYAGLASTLLPQSAPTNKQLKGVNGLKYSFSDAQLDDITGNRIVTFKNKYSASGRAIQGCVCVDGVTAARNGSEYTRLTTLKIMRDVANNTREVSEPFIGEPNTIEQRNALSSLLSKRYDKLIELGEILSYDMNLVSSQTDVALGQAKLELAIHAPEELKRITTVMGLKR